MRRYNLTSFFACFLLSGLFTVSHPLVAQDKIVWSEQEKPIFEQIRGLRSLDDTLRGDRTKDLALQIRQLPVVPNKLRLAEFLASRSTEGDFGRETLQKVTTTLAAALRELPPAEEKGSPSPMFVELASLVRYEHMQATSDNPQFTAAIAKLEADDTKRQNADFTLSDLQGIAWHLKDLHGKVVLVNFWATWCPLCRKEMPDLQALYDRFKDQGFVVLSISDEQAAKVNPLIAERKISYPVLLDPGDKVQDAFVVEGIPKSFVYDREGKMVAQSIDMRTRSQFAQMLAQAGLGSKDDTIRKIGTAAEIALKLHAQSLVGYVGVYIDEATWNGFSNDSDLGPFLKFKEPKNNRSAVVLISGTSQFVFCTYFDGASPFGTVALHPPGKHKIEANEVEAAYKTVTHDLTDGTVAELRFDEGTIETDDGKIVASFKIVGEEKATAK